MTIEGVIAANRFGLGARPGEVERASTDPKSWLVGQIAPADQPLNTGSLPFGTGEQLVAELTAYRQQRRQMRAGDNGTEALRAFAKQQRQILLDEMAARFSLGFRSERSFAERLVWFWSNHFTISTQGAGTASLAGAYEREAIRPFIAAKFEDMLLAVATHPAMLIYLNNAQSIGPNSRAGQLAGKGLNENFGRELMELYSLGVDGGYTQDDVIALAKLLTGWGIDVGGPPIARFFQTNDVKRVRTGDYDAVSSGFRFFPNRHEPGPITLRGKTYPEGFAGGREAIHDLAHDPATARFVARKFAVHFIADVPLPRSVARLELVFRNTDGDLKALAIAAVEDPAAWDPAGGKIRPPVEYVTASFRLLGLPHDDNAQRQTLAAMQASRLMGQFPMAAPAPKGWSDQSQDWSGADAILSRIEYARQLGTRIGQEMAPDQIASLARDALGSRLSANIRGAIASASNSGEAVALLISSPEFQRR